MLIQVLTCYAVNVMLMSTISYIYTPYNFVIHNKCCLEVLTTDSLFTVFDILFSEYLKKR